MLVERGESRRRRSRVGSPPEDASQRLIDRLQATVEKQQQEISALEAALAERNHLLKDARRQITRILRDCDDVAEPRVRKLLDLVVEGAAPMTTRRTFDEWLDVSKRSFIRKLSQRYPTLTPTELKICSMLKLNMRSSEIARLLTTSLRNVESHRYWIRKKLAIPTSVNLSTFLAAI